MRAFSTMLLVLLAAACRATAAEPTAPNIVILFADDLGYGDLSCYGHPTIRAPHIDRMAAESMRLTQFHGGGPQEHEPPLLFHLEQDPSEKFDVSKQHADIIDAIRRKPGLFTRGEANRRRFVR